VYRTKDFYIGKKIFEVFPEESIPKLLKLYETGDATTRGNVLRVCGSLVGPDITALLVNALNDKTFCDPEDPRSKGLPCAFAMLRTINWCCVSESRTSFERSAPFIVGKQGLSYLRPERETLTRKASVWDHALGSSS